jgi:hypothetical protein
MDSQLVLPLRPKPLTDELCSSWLLRLASECGLSLHTLRRVIAPRLRLPIYDFDRSVGVTQLATISKATLTDTNRVRDTLLRFEGVSTTGLSWLEQWLLPIGTSNREGKVLGYQYCPDCLAEGTPYFRRSWRFSFVVGCTAHGRHLADQCGRCGAAIHGLPIGLAGLERVLTPGGEPPFVRCGSCGCDLRDAGAAPRYSDGESLKVQARTQLFIQNTQKGVADARDYLVLLYRAAQLFAEELGTIPFEELKTRHRALVLKRASLLLDGDRWRYIQSLRGTPRPPMSEVIPSRKPAAKELLLTAEDLRSNADS